jgi:hypothetical protein
MASVARGKTAAGQDADAGRRQPCHEPGRASPVGADRILRYAAIVGRENVIAGTDCGLGGRLHADLAWAKLHTLAEGARLASQSLWP